MLGGILAVMKVKVAKMVVESWIGCKLLYSVILVKYGLQSVRTVKLEWVQPKARREQAPERAKQLDGEKSWHFYLSASF